MIRRVLRLAHLMVPCISYRGIFKGLHDPSIATQMKNMFFNFLKEEAFGDEDNSEMLNQTTQNPDSLLKQYETLIKTDSPRDAFAKFYSDFSSSIGTLTKEDILRFLNLSTINSINELYGRKDKQIELFHKIRQNQIARHYSTSGMLPIKALTNSYKNISKGIVENIFGFTENFDVNSLRSFIFQALEKPITLFIGKGCTVKELITVIEAFIAAQEGTEYFYESLGEGLLLKTKDFNIEDIDHFLNLFPHELLVGYDSMVQNFFTPSYYMLLTKVIKEVNTLDTKTFLSIFQGILTISPRICDLKEVMEVCFTRLVQILEKNELTNKQIAKFLEMLATHIETNESIIIDTRALANYVYILHLSKIDLDNLSIEEIMSILISFYRMKALSSEHFSQLFEKCIEKIKSTENNQLEVKEDLKILIEIGHQLSSPNVSILKAIANNIRNSS